MKYRAEIDGLRAVAVLPVILFHAGVSVFGGGYVGVDVFFVISGFLITTLLIREMDAGSFSLTGFYERRARRILPALFVVIAACLPLAWALLVPEDMKDFGQSIVAVMLFSSNLLFWTESGYFAPAAELKPLLHTWSLAVEEQYYILFPLFLMVTWRWGAKITLGLLTFGFALSLAAAQVLVFKDASFAFFMLPTRAWELLAGSLLAIALHRRPDLTPRGGLAQSGGLLGLGLICFAVLVFDGDTPFPSLYTLCPVLGAVLVIACAQPGTLIHGLLSHRSLVAIGLVSYSAYLWHQPLFAFARYSYAGHPPTAVMAALVGLTFVLAWLSWRWVEQPFRGKGTFTRARIFRLSGAGFVTCAMLGLTIHVTEGLPQRFSPLHQTLFASTSPSPMRGKCHNIDVPDKACRYFVPETTWAVIGDSHTVELAYGLATRLQAGDHGVMHFSRAGCGPLFGAETDSACSQWTARHIDYLLAEETIDTIVISYRIAAYLAGKHELIYPAQPDQVDAAKRRAVWQSYIRTMQAFVDQGKTVHLVLQAPEVPTHINHMLRRAEVPSAAPEGLWLAGVPRAWWRARMAPVMENLDDIPAGVHIHDPAATFCDETDCYLSYAGKALYFDDDHMSVTGARLIAEQIATAAKLPPAR